MRYYGDCPRCGLPFGFVRCEVRMNYGEIICLTCAGLEEKKSLAIIEEQLATLFDDAKP